MKKKGLIVATIVMVLVLAVSITTATYAWFTATAQTTIEAITFSVNSGSDVSIGLKTDNTYAAGASSSAFVSGTTDISNSFLTRNGSSLTFTPVIPTTNSDYWTGNQGLGSSIDMQLDLSGMSKAVGTGMVGATADNSFNFAQIRSLATNNTTGVIKSEGIGTVASTNGAEVAIAQRDYLDVVIGVQAARTDLYSITCNVTINPDSTNLDLGMNAAIHVAWAIDGMISASTNNNTDIYTDNRYSTTTSSLGYSLVGQNQNTNAYGGPNQTLNNGAANVAIPVAASRSQANTDYLLRETIYQIHLLIWIDGTDSDCLNQAQGVGSEILINFSTTHPERTAEGV